MDDLLRRRKNDCIIVIPTLFFENYLHDSFFCYTFVLGNKCKNDYE